MTRASAITQRRNNGTQNGSTCPLGHERIEQRSDNGKAFLLRLIPRGDARVPGGNTYYEESDRGQTITAKTPTKSMNSHQKTQPGKSPLFIL